MEQKIKIKWDPQGWVCPHCGTSNPDGGDRCGNCDRNPFILPKELLTPEQMLTFKTVKNRRKKIA